MAPVITSLKVKVCRRDSFQRTEQQKDLDAIRAAVDHMLEEERLRHRGIAWSA
jgi:hypothetical protein